MLILQFVEKKDPPNGEPYAGSVTASDLSRLIRGAGVPFDRLNTLIRAAMEGRLIVLPRWIEDGLATTPYQIQEEADV